MYDISFYSKYKSARILKLYTKLLNGESVSKSEEADFFQVSPKTIQRDIDELRAFFDNQSTSGLANKTLVYDHSDKCYYLKDEDKTTLTNSEILAVCKILLESRAFRKDDMQSIVEKILSSSVTHKNRSDVTKLVANELYHYVEPHHKKHFVEMLWDVGSAINSTQYLLITYEKQDGSVVERKIKPVAIMFSEFYFYLTAFIDDIDKKSEFTNPDDIFPTIYRIDRIKNLKALNEHFIIPYRDRFEDGEFRKRIQFMYGGKLRKIKFVYRGKNIESVLDRLPTAVVLDNNADGYTVSAEVFGKGIDMWIRSQGENVEVICE